MQHIDWLLRYVWEVHWTKYLINIPKHSYQSKNTCTVTFFWFFTSCNHNIYILTVTRLCKFYQIQQIFHQVNKIFTYHRVLDQMCETYSVALYAIIWNGFLLIFILGMFYTLALKKLQSPALDSLIYKPICIVDMVLSLESKTSLSAAIYLYC